MLCFWSNNSSYSMIPSHYNSINAEDSTYSIVNWAWELIFLAVFIKSSSGCYLLESVFLTVFIKSTFGCYVSESVLLAVSMRSASGASCAE